MLNIIIINKIIVFDILKENYFFDICDDFKVINI